MVTMLMFTEQVIIILKNASKVHIRMYHCPKVNERRASKVPSRQLTVFEFEYFTELTEGIGRSLSGETFSPT